MTFKINYLSIKYSFYNVVFLVKLVTLTEPEIISLSESAFVVKQSARCSVLSLWKILVSKYYNKSGHWI